MIAELDNVWRLDMAKALANEYEYQSSLKRLNDIMHADEGTPEYAEAEDLITKIQAYENPFGPGIPDPIETIKFAMENKGWTITNLEPILQHDIKAHAI
jgi:HTH-type transcriptional regulator/antitoxin HigA